MTIASEAPETLRVVNRSIGDTASVFAGVDETEVVASWLAFLQVGGEQTLLKTRFSVGEKGILGLWLNWKMVSLAPGEMKTRNNVKDVNIPVLMDGKARPSKPSLLVS